VRVLDGPAGRYLYGTQLGDISSPVELQARIAEHGALDVVSELRAQRTGEFKQALRQTFNRDEVPQERTRVTGRGSPPPSAPPATPPAPRTRRPARARSS
jgi:hypothetical protein